MRLFWIVSVCERECVCGYLDVLDDAVALQPGHTNLRVVACPVLGEFGVRELWVLVREESQTD